MTSPLEALTNLQKALEFDGPSIYVSEAKLFCIETLVIYLSPAALVQATTSLPDIQGKAWLDICWINKVSVF